MKRAYIISALVLAIITGLAFANGGGTNVTTQEQRVLNDLY